MHEQSTSVDDEDGFGESEAIRHLVLGDEIGINYLMRKYSSRLTASLLKNYGESLTQEDAEEIVSDTFFRAFKNGHRYDQSKSAIFTWLYVISKRLALTLIAKQGERTIQFEEAPYEHHTGGPEVDKSECPSAWMDEQLKLLPKGRAEIIRKYYYENNSVSALAMLLEVQEVSVRSRLSRAHKDLGSILRGDSDV